MEGNATEGTPSHSSALALELDAMHRIADANASAGAALGRRSSELRGWPWSEALLPERLRERGERALADFLARHGGTPGSFVCPVRAGDGSIERAVAWCVLPQPDDDRGPLLVGTPLAHPQRSSEGMTIRPLPEVADRARLDEEVVRDARFHRSIVEHLPNMIFVKDAGELRFVRFNRAGEELLGLRRDQLIGRNDYDFFPPEQADFFTAKDREVLHQGRVVDIPEEPIHTADKGRRWLHTKKIPLNDARGRAEYLLGISEDVTETKEAEEARERLNDELARSNAELEQFAYVASHDLQEPLRTVRSFAELLERRYRDTLDVDGREFLSYIVGGVERMQRLIDGLLAYSRVDTQARAFRPVSLSEVLEEALEDLRIALDESGGRITHDPLPRVEADPQQMSQLFRNLLGNALKFRGADPPLVHVSAEWNGSAWRIGVADNGVGIPEQHRERIFRIFERLDRREDDEGTGLGLAICKRIVERHGGRLWPETPADGTGTVFCATLPPASDEGGDG